MRKLSIICAVSLSASLAMSGFVLAADQSKVESLRGADIDEPIAVEDVFHQDDSRFVRNYRQQPPLIPHTVEQYQIDLAANECLSCHDWTKSGERRAPTLSMTHYLDRNGKELDTISGTRWFCNQCHVPQADAPALVENTFQSSN